LNSYETGVGNALRRGPGSLGITQTIGRGDRKGVGRRTPFAPECTQPGPGWKPAPTSDHEEKNQMSTRTERINHQLKVEISDIMRRELRDPKLGFVTITDADVTSDLRHANVYISVLGDEKAKMVSLRVLQKAAGFIRGEFGRRAHLKTIPEIHFKLDTAIDQGMRMFELLQQVKPHDQVDQVEPHDEE
jgi:ribosome-binding factor A